MKVDRNINRKNIEENSFYKNDQKKVTQKRVINGFTYYFPHLVNRSRCFTYNPAEGCLYCRNKTFRYYSTVYEKKYYQCEKCGGINH